MIQMVFHIQLYQFILKIMPCTLGLKSTRKLINSLVFKTCQQQNFYWNLRITPRCRASKSFHDLFSTCSRQIKSSTSTEYWRVDGHETDIRWETITKTINEIFFVLSSSKINSRERQKVFDFIEHCTLTQKSYLKFC